MTKLNEKSMVELEIFLSFDEDWKTEDELIKLGEKHGFEIKEIYKLHGTSGGAAEVLAIAPINLLLKNQYIYEKNGKYYEENSDIEIA